MIESISQHIHPKKYKGTPHFINTILNRCKPSNQNTHFQLLLQSMGNKNPLYFFTDGAEIIRNDKVIPIVFGLRQTNNIGIIRLQAHKEGKKYYKVFAVIRNFSLKKKRSVLFYIMGKKTTRKSYHSFKNEL